MLATSRMRVRGTILLMGCLGSSSTSVFAVKCDAQTHRSNSSFPGVVFRKSDFLVEAEKMYAWVARSTSLSPHKCAPRIMAGGVKGARCAAPPNTLMACVQGDGFCPGEWRQAKAREALDGKHAEEDQEVSSRDQTCESRETCCRTLAPSLPAVGSLHENH